MKPYTAYKKCKCRYCKDPEAFKKNDRHAARAAGKPKPADQEPALSQAEATDAECIAGIFTAAEGDEL